MLDQLHNKLDKVIGLPLKIEGSPVESVIPWQERNLMRIEIINIFRGEGWMYVPPSMRKSVSDYVASAGESRVSAKVRAKSEPKRELAHPKAQAERGSV